MMPHKYGEFTDYQISQTIKKIRKYIYFLLMCVDPPEGQEKPEVDVEQAFNNLLYRLGGMNDILMSPPALVDVISLLQAALNEYLSPAFDFSIYRKLVLDAGAEIKNIRGDAL